MKNDRLLINEQYEVRQQLEGGMGCVFIAFDQVTQMMYALKTLKEDLKTHPTAGARFEREARMWIQLGAHEHVVRAISYYRGALPLLMLEYIDGPTLGHLIASEPNGMAISEVLHLGVQLAQGLGHAHRFRPPGKSLGIVHRDFKPANVLVSRKRIAKVTDFGLARAHEASDLTDSNHLLGTLPYMAPEQWVDARVVDERADIFSLGAVLYEMIAGTRPFRGTATQLLHQIKECDPRPLDELRDDVPPELAALVMRCLAKQPDDRPRTTEELSDSLLAIQSHHRRQAQALACCATCGYTPQHRQVRCPICGTEMPAPPSQIALAPPGRCCDCGGESAAHHRFCIACGKRFDDSVTCRICGQTNAGRHPYCIYCGELHALA